jgi:phosphoglycolate phosphatase-like HAD superfamily hydrolase
MTIDTSRIKALCFDVDGTLSDTDEVFAAGVLKFFQPFAFLFKDRDAARAARRFVMWTESPGNFLIGIPDILGVDDEIFSMLEWINRKRPRPHKTFLLIAGVKEMLIALKPYYKMSIVSARDDRSTRIFLDRFELTPLFDVIVTAITAEHTKPFPDPILYAARAMGVDPRECLMIGDTTVDIRAGKAAGAQTVGVLCGFGEEDELRKKGADSILKATDELTRLLETA